jgi:hypothetical protein
LESFKNISQNCKQLKVLSLSNNRCVQRGRKRDRGRGRGRGEGREVGSAESEEEEGRRD